MMHCETYHELVAAHVDDCLSGEERSLVEQHLASCVACRQLFAREQQFRTALGARQVRVAVPEAVEQRLRTALAAERASSPSVWERVQAWLDPAFVGPRFTWGTALASLFVVVGLFQLLSPSSPALFTWATDYYPAVTQGRMTLDHPATDPRQVQTALNNSGQLDFTTHALDLASAGYQLRGGTVVSEQEGPTAVVYYTHAQHEAQPLVCLRQSGRMPSPGSHAHWVKSDAYVYDQDGYTVLVSQFSDHFCTLVSRLPGDVFLHQLGMPEMAS